MHVLFLVSTIRLPSAKQQNFILLNLSIHTKMYTSTHLIHFTVLKSLVCRILQPILAPRIISPLPLIWYICVFKYILCSKNNWKKIGKQHHINAILTHAIYRRKKKRINAIIINYEISAQYLYGQLLIVFVLFCKIPQVSSVNILSDFSVFHSNMKWLGRKEDQVSSGRRLDFWK